MRKHTKGPWVVDGPTVNSESYDCYYVKTKDGTIVAEIGGWGGSGGMENDARLIAAAPEMLEACKGVLGAIEFSGWDIDDPEWRKPIATAREVIAKAEET